MLTYCDKYLLLITDDYGARLRLISITNNTKLHVNMFLSNVLWIN